MTLLILPTDAAGNPVSALLAGLTNRKIPLDHGDDNPHPLAAQAVAYRHLAGSMTTFLESYDYAVTASKSADLPADQSTALVENFRQVIYRATEALDFYAISLPMALGVKRHRSLREAGREYSQTIKSRRDHWALMCNKLKHSANVLIPAAIRYLPFGPNVLGFGICSFQRDTLAPNPLIHPSRKALGYIAELHQLAADLLRCDLAAGRLATCAMEHSTAPIIPGSATNTLALGTILARIAHLAPIGMGEHRMQDVLVLIPEGVQITKQLLPLPSSRGKLQVHFAGDGFTRSFGVFG